MSAERLRPQAEGALRRAAARGVERDVRMQQEGHVVACHVHVALVDLGRPRHCVQVFNLRAVWVVEDLAVLLVADAEDFIQRLALGKLNYGIVELAATDKVEHRALVQSAIRVGGHRRADERNADGRIGFLDRFSQPLVAFPAYRGGKQHKEFVVLADVDGFFRGNVMRRCIEHARTLKETGGVRKPDRVPVGFNLARCGPARTRATVEILERRRVQEECFQGHRHPFYSSIQAVFSTEFCRLFPCPVPGKIRPPASMASH